MEGRGRPQRMIANPSSSLLLLYMLTFFYSKDEDGLFLDPTLKDLLIRNQILGSGFSKKMDSYEVVSRYLAYRW